MPQAIDERFPGGEWLDPLAGRLSSALELLDRARLAVLAVTAAVVLLYVGAKVERHLLKQRLAVLDGAGGPADREDAGGGRG